MANGQLDQLRAEVSAIQPSKWEGRAIDIGRGSIVVSGLAHVAALGDLVEIHPQSGPSQMGEILSLSGTDAVVLPDGAIEGLQLHDRVTLLGINEISPDSSWLGRIVDPYGKALDGRPLLRGLGSFPLRGAPKNAANRRSLGARLETGMRVFNTMLPIVRGQRLGLFAGSGVGKSTLMGKLATGLDADVVVIAMIGERGRELREFVERILGPAGMSRAVIVAATSDQSAVRRRRCAWAAMAVAEYFRDQGDHVLFFADSITRFAEAHREVALAVGEPGSLRGYPPSTASAITELCERAGPGYDAPGDITAIFSILVAASDMEGPIADMLRGVLDGHVVLDRAIAERGRFPAIDLLRSVSRSLPDAATDSENDIVLQARKLLGVYEHHEMMVKAGLYTKGSDAEIDHAISAWSGLDAFIAQSEGLGGTTASFEALAECLAQQLGVATPTN